MRSTAFLVLAGATAALASSSSHKTMAKHRRQSVEKRGSGYTLETFAKGQDFLDLFDYEEGSHNDGVANYVSESTAKKDNLVWVNPKDDTVHLRVDNSTAPASMRNAIKLVGKKTFNTGLFLIDIERQPQVCGVWPAIWATSLTETWPAGGEIDLVEYVSRQTDNGFSVHTTPGCYAGSSGYSGTAMLAGSNALNCDADATDSQGCGFRSTQNVSAGIGANYHKGGVYALDISESKGISAWFFPRSKIPSDITAKNPDPSSWGTPDMYISPSSCKPSTYFKNLGLIINTNLGGTWAEGVWNSDNSYAGQTDGSCASQTGYATAADYVLSEGQDFRHAYWKFRSLSIYN